MSEETTSVRPDDVIPPAGPSLQPRKLVEDVVLLLPNIIKLVSRLLKDRRVPRRSKIILGLAAAYVASPVDLIPEIVPVIGWADDVIIMLFAIDHLIDRAGPEIIDEHWDGPVDLLSLTREAMGVSRAVLPKGFVQMLDRLSG